MILYNMLGSPPCRAVRMVARHIGVDLTIKEVDLLSNDHETSEFRKVNPFNRVPALDDDGFVVFEGNTIMRYLIAKYAPNSDLYPASCYKTRTQIDQILDGLISTIQPALLAVFRPQFFHGQMPSEEAIKGMEKNCMEKVTLLLEDDKKYLVGDKFTLADIGIIAHLAMPIERNPSLESAKHLEALAESEVNNSIMLGDLYHFEMSPPCLGVRMVAKELDIELNLIEVNIMAGETHTPQFLAMNPQHSVPTLVDGDLKLGESRAIMTYLVNQYAPDHSIYPIEAKTRARIDRFLYFDVGTLYPALLGFVTPIVFRGEPPDVQKVAGVQNALKIFNDLLPDEEETFLLGENTYTLADISMAASLCLIDISNFGYADCQKVEAYHALIKEKLPYFEEVTSSGVQKFTEFFQMKQSQLE